MSSSAAVEPNSTIAISSVAPSQAFTLCVWALNAIELSVQLMALLISAFNFSLLYSTALLHRNLRVILLAQTTVIALCEINRSLFIVLKFVCADPFFHGAFPLQLIAMATVYFRNLMGHVLMAERVYATIHFRTYSENSSRSSIQFTICWLALLLAISIWNTYVHQGMFYYIDAATFTSACILFALGCVEILSLSAIYLYNLRIYKNGFYLTLNERFQLSENIRTAKQLTPTVFIHFMNANLMSLVTFLFYFGVLIQPHQQSFVYLLLSLGTSIACACIELTVITHHPTMKRKAVDWLKKHLLLSVRRIGDSGALTTPTMATSAKNGGGGGGGTAAAVRRNLLDIHGQSLLTESEPDIYFQKLGEEWR